MRALEFMALLGGFAAFLCCVYLVLFILISSTFGRPKQPTTIKWEKR
jgi:hypothetical protein